MNNNSPPKAKSSDQITVISAIKLTPDQLNTIKNEINKKMMVNFPAVNIVDQKLLGGFTVQVKDWFFDSSLSHQVEFIKRSLLE